MSSWIRAWAGSGFGLTFSDVKVGRLEFKGSVFTSSSGSLGHTCWGLLIILIV